MGSFRKPETFEERVNGWIVSEDTGTSSKTIWAVMMNTYPGHVSVPSDLDDFGRCKRLLELIPEWKGRLPEVVEQYPEWAVIVKHWGNIEREFNKSRPVSYIIDEIVKHYEDSSTSESHN